MRNQIKSEPILTFKDILLVIYFAITFAPFITMFAGIVTGTLTVIDGKQLWYTLVSTFLAMSGLFMVLLPKPKPKESSAAIAAARLTNRYR